MVVTITIIGNDTKTNIKHKFTQLYTTTNLNTTDSYPEGYELQTEALYTNCSSQLSCIMSTKPLLGANLQRISVKSRGTQILTGSIYNI